MVYYDTDSRLQFAREHADRLATEMRRSRRLTPDEVGFFSRARLAPALAGQLERLRRRAGHHTPAYDA
jgi:hypothetical protein